jgi:hypothetical protein
LDGGRSVKASGAGSSAAASLYLMLVSEIESAFEVTMNDDDIMEIQTVADIKKTLKKLGITT